MKSPKSLVMREQIADDEKPSAFEGIENRVRALNLFFPRSWVTRLEMATSYRASDFSDSPVRIRHPESAARPREDKRERDNFENAFSARSLICLDSCGVE